MNIEEVDPSPVHFDDLIYDIGMHNGDDTAYYLHKGYRVIAIEANPALAKMGERRFSEAIDKNRLQILNIGITETRGEAEFHVAVENDIWSSFDIKIASRECRPTKTVRVACESLAEIVARYGVPYYMKIDIEGNDRFCIESLSPNNAPTYISVEMSHRFGDRDIKTLRTLGYRKFQCIRQNDFLPIHARNIIFNTSLRRYRTYSPLSAFIVRAIRRIRSAIRFSVDSGWTFPEGSSGTFGTSLPNAWMSEREMLNVWARLRDVNTELEAQGLGEWFDIHARR